jgi:hypothetical protein
MQELAGLFNELDRVSVTPSGRVGMTPKRLALTEATRIPSLDQSDARKNDACRILSVRVGVNDIPRRPSDRIPCSVFATGKLMDKEDFP